MILSLLQKKTPIRRKCNEAGQISESIRTCLAVYKYSKHIYLIEVLNKNLYRLTKT